MTKEIKNVVVVGGGTAGWLTASLLSAELATNGVRVTLIESPTIGTIGVGEGTWPSMRSTLERIGFSENTLFKECNASFKQGSMFVNWKYDNQPHVYQHPFSAPWQSPSFDTSLFWVYEHKSAPFAHVVNGQPRLIELGKAPKDITTPEYAAINNYGYHFDAGLFVEHLASHAVSKLGVSHLQADVVTVHEDNCGYIKSLETADGQCVDGDLFVDCSGLNGFLISKHFGVGFVPVDDELLNDRAIALQVPYSDANDNINSATIATAYDCGWVWDIGLQTRRGMGIVYSSKMTNQEQALACLKAHASKYFLNVENLTPKFIHYQPGYREKFWHKNVVAVGMAAGFLEPLEASALVMVEQAASFIASQFPYHHAQLAFCEARYNTLFTEKWRDIVDFLKLHYVLSERSSDYWQFHRTPDTQSERLKSWLAQWQYIMPNRFDVPQIESLFPFASFQYVLYGMGFESDVKLSKSQIKSALNTKQHYPQLIENTKRQVQLPTNRVLIEKIKQFGMPSI